MLAKKYILGLQTMVTSANEKYISLQRASTELIGAVTDESEFSTANHLQEVKKEGSEGKNPGMM